MWSLKRRNGRGKGQRPRRVDEKIAAEPFNGQDIACEGPRKELGGDYNKFKLSHHVPIRWNRLGNSVFSKIYDRDAEPP